MWAGGLVERGFGQKLHRHQIVPWCIQHGRGVLRAIAHLGHGMLHGGQVALQRGFVGRLHGTLHGGGGLDLHRAVRGRGTEDHGNVAGGGNVGQKLS